MSDREQWRQFSNDWSDIRAAERFVKRSLKRQARIRALQDEILASIPEQKKQANLAEISNLIAENEQDGKGPAKYSSRAGALPHALQQGFAKLVTGLIWIGVIAVLLKWLF